MSKAKSDDFSVVIERNKIITDSQIESLTKQLAYLRSLQPPETDTDAAETTLDIQIAEVQGVIDTTTNFLARDFGDEESTIENQSDVIKKVLEYIRSIPINLAVWEILEIQIIEYITQLGSYSTDESAEPRLTDDAIKTLLLQNFPGVFRNEDDPLVAEVIGLALPAIDGVPEEENANVDNTVVGEQDTVDNIRCMGCAIS